MSSTATTTQQSPRASTKDLVSRTAALKRESSVERQQPDRDHHAAQRAVDYLFSANKPSVEAKMLLIGITPKSAVDAHRRTQLENALRDGRLPFAPFGPCAKVLREKPNHPELR